MKKSKINAHIQQWITRIVSNKRIGHAYLFSGKRGSGKKDAALYFAQAILCMDVYEGQPCGECRECQRIVHMNHPDVHFIEKQGLSIKIDQVRQLQKEFAYKGLETERKIYIISAMETMTAEAANSLLKFLEEPHPGTVAILMVENKALLLPTIISRCQEIQFPPPQPAVLAQELATKYDRQLAFLAANMTSDYEEAANLCTEDWFADLKKIVLQLTQGFTRSHHHIGLIDSWLKAASTREQMNAGLDMLLFWFKDVLHVKINMNEQPIYIDDQESIHAHAQQWSVSELGERMLYITEAKQKLQAHVHQQLLLEQLLFKLPQAG